VEAIAESFLQVLLLARELGVLQVGMVSVDGTKVDANASKHRSVRYDRAKALVEQLRLDIEGLLKRAERADASEVEAQARERAQSERAEYERKLREREARNGKGKGTDRLLGGWEASGFQLASGHLRTRRA
jgi:hypothetical protein